jgi:hypothetical protein
LVSVLAERPPGRRPSNSRRALPLEGGRPGRRFAANNQQPGTNNQLFGRRSPRIHRTPGPRPLMPSFDIVSELDKQEVRNAVDQANRELVNRFDFRGTGCAFEQDEFVVTMKGQSEYQLKQMLEILKPRLIGRGIDMRCAELADAESNVAAARQKLTLKQGIDQKNAKDIIKRIKDAKLKVEAQINAEKVRVSAKKRDDLQAVIALLRAAELELPLQFENFRD